MKRMVLIYMLINGFVLNWNTVSADEGFYVIPVKKNNYTPVPKTGQTISYEVGDDGDLEMGSEWPNPRFTDNGNGTVTDNLTKLIWLKNANCFGARDWATALTDCNTLNTGECQLTDGSLEGEWRLPNIRELQSLIDYGQISLTLPSDSYKFFRVQSAIYWSSTRLVYDQGYVYMVSFGFGTAQYAHNTSSYYVWPVRDGN